jgi:hypothetical protein
LNAKNPFNCAVTHAQISHGNRLRSKFDCPGNEMVPAVSMTSNEGQTHVHTPQLLISVKFVQK